VDEIFGIFLLATLVKEKNLGYLLQAIMEEKIWAFEEDGMNENKINFFGEVWSG